MSDCIYIIIIIVLCWELLKIYSIEKFEVFSNNKTNYIVSNTKEKSASDKYVNENEEILIVKQNNTDQIIIFSYIRAPLNKYLAIYAKKITPLKEELINTVLINNVNIINETKKIISSNAIFLGNDIQINYYLKFLDDNSYKYELQKQNELKNTSNNYSNCLNMFKDTHSAYNVISICNEKVKFT